MLQKKYTKYGDIYIIPDQEIYILFWEKICSILLNNNQKKIASKIALSGGNTAKKFYKNIVSTLDRSSLIKKYDINSNNIQWTVSDERYVPLSHQDSNFGQAKKYFFPYLDIKEKNTIPWNTDLHSQDAVNNFNCYWKNNPYLFDICVLGMGSDAHIASIFPYSSLLQNKKKCYFSTVDVKDKGKRLTITPFGLYYCQFIFILITESSKANTLKAVHYETYNPLEKPVQLTAKLSQSKVMWFISESVAKDSII